AQATLTPTAPIVAIDLVLEPAGDRYFRLFEKLRSGNTPVALGQGLFSLRLTQPGASGSGVGYDYALLAPEGATDRFLFPGVLLSRSGSVTAEELTGERRRASAKFSSFVQAPPVPGSGTQADPYQLLPTPQGTVRVWVRDANGQLVPGANVTLNAPGAVFPSVTGADGSASFAAVPVGTVSASAKILETGTSGYATGTLTYDDDLLELNVSL